MFCVSFNFNYLFTSQYIVRFLSYALALPILPHLKYSLVLFGSEGSALTLTLFLQSARIIMLCHFSSTVTKYQFLLVSYGTKWPLCVDVPLNTYSFIHSLTPQYILHFLSYALSLLILTFHITVYFTLPLVYALSLLIPCFHTYPIGSPTELQGDLLTWANWWCAYPDGRVV